MPGIFECASRHGALVWSFMSDNKLKATVWSFESASRVSSISGLLRVPTG